MKKKFRLRKTITEQSTPKQEAKAKDEPKSLINQS